MGLVWVVFAVFLLGFGVSEAFEDETNLGFVNSQPFSYQGMELVASAKYEPTRIPADGYENGTLTIQIIDTLTDQHFSYEVMRLEIFRDGGLLARNLYEYANSPMEIEIIPVSECAEEDFWKCTVYYGTAHSVIAGVLLPDDLGPLKIQGPVFDREGTYDVDVAFEGGSSPSPDVDPLPPKFSLSLKIFETQKRTHDFKNPRQQLAVGIEPEKVECKEGLQLIFKPNNDVPSCVSEKTATKLLKRGWIMPSNIISNISNTSDKIWIGNIPTQCANPWDEFSYTEYQTLDRETRDIIKHSYDDRRIIELDIIQKFYEQKGAQVFDKKTVDDVVPGDICEGCACNDGGHGVYFQVLKDDLEHFGTPEGYPEGFDIWYKFEDGINQYNEDSTWFFKPKSALDECAPNESPNCHNHRYYDMTCKLYGLFYDESGNPVAGIPKGMYQDFVTIDYSACDEISASATITTGKDEYYIGEEVTFYLTNDGEVPISIFRSGRDGLSISVNGNTIGHTGNPGDVKRILQPGEQTQVVWDQEIWPNRIIGVHPMEAPEYIVNPDTMSRHTKVTTYDVSLGYHYHKGYNVNVPVKIIEGYQWTFAVDQTK